ncbi:MAG: 50S ribosomal protein L6 [Elusimicrobia bacterium GWA2_69_24]|nr:MAG: 50S ribosomal protein L6 [Elusimicrobia bacterium GWA2_69_24]
MSRVGRKPIDVPAGIDVRIKDSTITVKGPLGELCWAIPRGISAEQKDKQVLLTISPALAREAGGPAMYGMSRAKMANMVAGVQTGFSKELEIHGLGFRATSESPNKMSLMLGYTHPVPFESPKGVTMEVDKKATKIVVKGIDKEVVGRVAAQIRLLRRPEPYKGTGIRYAGERIIRKAGKTAAGAGSGGAGGAKK